MSRFAGLIAILFVIIIGAKVQYLKNEKLHTIKESYLGNKAVNGRFVEYVSQTKGILDLIK